MRYAFIKEHCHLFPIGRMCQVLGVSSSGYYGWRQRPVSTRAKANEGLKFKIEIIYQASDGTYGSPRIYQELVAMGVGCSLNRVARLMRRHGIVAKQSKKWPVVTTDRNLADPVAPNLLDRHFQALEPNRKWLADITYIQTDEGLLYLAAVMDLYSRKIVGWAMADHLQTELPLAALQMALQQRHPEPGLLHHSDRGSQYTSDLYQSVLHGYRCRVSMSRVANCLDNAPMESFFGTLKTERTDHRHYRTRAEAQSDIFLYIEGFYNRRRRHSYLGYLSPDQFEEQLYFSLN
jgi:transposase InsO family protein